MDISGLTSAYTDYLTNQASSSSVDALKDKLTTDYSTATDDELLDACKQFEAYFLEQVFKGMQKTIPESEYSSSSTSTLVDYYKDSMIQELAAQSTETNSIGLAQTMYEQMKRNYQVNITEVETATETVTETATDNA